MIQDDNLEVIIFFHEFKLFILRNSKTAKSDGIERSKNMGKVCESGKIENMRRESWELKYANQVLELTTIFAQLTPYHDF